MSLLSLLLIGLSSNAQGAILHPEFTATDLSLKAGQTSTFTLNLDLGAARFVGGKVTIFSGDGDKQTFRIKKRKPSQAFTASFLYEKGGDFTARYIVEARYRKRKQIVDPSDLSAIFKIIFARGRERLNGQLGLQVADARGDFPKPPLRSIAVPGPIAGAGLPALMGLGGFVWARRRKAAVTA